jgi:hypothetical protein
MIVVYENGMAWLPRVTWSWDERKVCDAVEAALPNLPATVKIDETREYVKVDEGSNWVEYEVNAGRVCQSARVDCSM